MASSGPVKRMMSKAASGRTEAACAKAGVVTLVEVDLHNPIGAAIGPAGQTEMALTQALMAQLPERSLWLSDRYCGLPGLILKTAGQYPERGRECLRCLRRNLKAQGVEVFPDGSALLEIRNGQERRLVREIFGQVQRGRGQWSTVRLWTRLRDGLGSPGAELLAVSARRW